VKSGSTERTASHPDSSGGRSGTDAFEHISSLSNETVKLLRSLDRKKTRSETGLFLAEGGRLLEEALAHGWKPACVLAGTATLSRPRTVDLLSRAKLAGARILTVSDKVLGAVSRKDNPQTILAALHQRRADLESFATEGPRRWLALYEVRDPGNLGTILRTADAAGVDGVVLIGNCCDPFSVEAVRATMGSLFAMPLAISPFAEFDDWRKRAGARLLAASMRATARHDQTDFSDKSVVLMGNEQAGLPPDLEALCDALVRIPMRGAADSLNLAAAASLMIYEVWRSSGYRGADR